MRGVQQQRAQSHPHLRRPRLLGGDDVVPLLTQPDREQPRLGGLARALTALEGDQQPAVDDDRCLAVGMAGHRRERLAAHHRGQVVAERDPPAVVHLAVGDQPQPHRHHGGQDQHEVVADGVVAHVADAQRGRPGRAGHQGGDRALRCFGELMRDEVRDFDIAARLGGEEFAVLLPQTKAEAAAVVAARMREATYQPDQLICGG